MARPKLTDEGVGKPICVRLTEDLTAQLSAAAAKLDMPQSEIMRLCMRIGIEHFKRIDYDTAKCIVETVENQAPKAESSQPRTKNQEQGTHSAKVIPMYEQSRPKKDKLKIASPGVSYEAAAQEHGLDDCHEGQH